MSIVESTHISTSSFDSNFLQTKSSDRTIKTFKSSSNSSDLYDEIQVSSSDHENMEKLETSSRSKMDDKLIFSIDVNVSFSSDKESATKLEVNDASQVNSTSSSGTDYLKHFISKVSNLFEVFNVNSKKYSQSLYYSQVSNIIIFPIFIHYS